MPIEPKQVHSHGYHGYLHAHVSPPTMLIDVLAAMHFNVKSLPEMLSPWLHRRIAADTLDR